MTNWVKQTHLTSGQWETATPSGVSDIIETSVFEVEHVLSTGRHKDNIPNVANKASFLLEHNTDGTHKYFRHKTPEEYGAVADGLTNNTAAYALMIASGYKVFEFGTGTYLGNLNITDKTGITIRGQGKATILKTASSSDPVIKINSAAVQIEKAVVKDMLIDGNGQVVGLSITATNPYIVAQSKFSDLYIYNTTKGIYNSGSSTAVEVYNNTFERIKILNPSSFGIHETAYCVYNKYRDMEITGVGDGAYAIAAQGNHGSYENIQVDGVIIDQGQDNHWSNNIIETIYATTPPQSYAFGVAGYKTHINNLVLTNVAAAKSTYGVDISNDGHVINTLRIYGTDYPTFPFNLQAGSSGMLVNVINKSYGAQLQAYTSASIIKNWIVTGGDYYSTKPEYGAYLVSTATTILDAGAMPNGKLRSGLYVVQGTKYTVADGTVGFTDLILLAATENAQTVTAVSSQTINGAAARTYSLSGTNVQLAMASDTYIIAISGMSLNVLTP